MTILALDLSLTATGWATTIDEYGVYSSKERGVVRLYDLRGWLLDSFSHYYPDLVVMEGYAFNKGQKAHQVGEWGGVARLAIYDTARPFVEIPPAVLKKFAAGRGTATKPDMRVALLQRTGMDVRDDNAVDALWLLAAAHQATGDPLWEMPKANVEALDKVTWPQPAPTEGRKP